MTDKEYLELYKKNPEYKKYKGWEEDFQKIQEYNKALIEKYPFLQPRNVWSDEIVEDYKYEYSLLDSMPEGWRLAFGLEMCEELKAELLKYNYLDKYRITQIKEKYGTLRWYDNGWPVGKLSEDFEWYSRPWNSDVLFPKDIEEYHYSQDHIDDPEKVRDDWNLDGKIIEHYRYSDKAIVFYKKRKIEEKCKGYDIISKYGKLSGEICIRCGKPAKYETKGWINFICEDCARKDYKIFQEHLKSQNKNYKEITFDDYYYKIDEESEAK